MDQQAMRLDALQEIVNIGGGNAATSLSQLINKSVQMDIPTIEFMEYEKVYETICSEDEQVRAILMKLLGQEGVFLFVLSPDDAVKIADMVLPESVEASEELVDSANKELVNILVNSFLNALNKMLGVDLIASVPVAAQDMFGSILSSVYIEQEQYDSQIFIIKNEFYSDGNKIEGALYFVPKPGVLEKLFETLGL
ncbi:chemotaxis protein CheC [Lacticigenium naphthae]|uniref:chemotaxis protein CheC n=1 Tax=Lacticigenium naphthae TaxID=515351 RepID=UPI00041E98E0|nr:chemotaxis protein CheC [Lacticigenium naphthae]